MMIIVAELNTLKRTFALLLMTIVLLSGALALADETAAGGLYTYSFNEDGTVTVTGYDWGKHQGNLSVSGILDGYTVTGIGCGAFADGRGIYTRDKSLTLPSTITTIGDRAFFNTGLETVVIPDSVTSIGRQAFNYVDRFIVAASHPKYAEFDGALYEKQSKKLISYVPGAKIPEGITAIGDFAVSGQYNVSQTT